MTTTDTILETRAALKLPPELSPRALADAWTETEIGTRFDPGPLHNLGAVELAEHLDTLDTAIAALKDRLATVQAVADQVIDRQILTRRGRAIGPVPDTTRTAWNKTRIRELVLEQRSRLLVDPETGDTIRALPERELGDLIEVKTGVNVARGLGVRTGDLCTEARVTKAKWL